MVFAWRRARGNDRADDVASNRHSAVGVLQRVVSVFAARALRAGCASLAQQHRVFAIADDQVKGAAAATIFANSRMASKRWTAKW